MSEDAEEAQSQVESKPRKRWVVYLVIPVLAVSAGMAGAILGPRLAGTQAANAAEKKPAKEQKHEAESDEVAKSLRLDPIIVDVRDADAMAHHMKVGMTLELYEGVLEEEIDKLTPRGRQAAIAYLRGRSFEQLTKPGDFKKVVKELNEAVKKAYGKKRVSRLVITDYVSQ